MRNLLSVIIPMYNSDCYLERCLTSLTKQTYNPIEIIIIDDSSADNSIKIAKQFISKFTYIKLFSIKHGGPSAARNYGLIKSKGKYITFVDSDDEVLPYIYEKAIAKMEKESLDLLVFSWLNINEGKISNCRLQDLYFKRKEYFKNIIAVHELYGGGFPWNKIIRKSCLYRQKKLILFDTNFYVYEDKLWLFSISNNINRISCIKDIGYKYYIHNSSLAHKKNSIDKQKQLIDAFFRMRTICLRNRLLNYTSNKYFLNSIAEAYILAEKNFGIRYFPKKSSLIFKIIIKLFIRKKKKLNTIIN